MSLIKVPVTALAVYKEYLLAGVGSFIKIYTLTPKSGENDTTEVLFVKKIFNRHVVHGLKVFNCQKSFIVAYGGQEWCICKLTEDDDDLLQILFSSKIHDWIWDVSLIYRDIVNDDIPRLTHQIAFALGHNSVVLYDRMQDKIIVESHCEEKCILYSAYFVADERPTWNSLTLCSGTVFNQVVIWRPGSRDQNKIIQRIHAHDGVIFSIDFDFNTGLLITASDDRSIRLWKCKSLETYSSSNNVDFDSNNYLCKLYGHESRVWRAQCIKYRDRSYLISVGEDSHCIIWDLSISHDRVEGKMIRKIRCHKGRNIWSLIIDHDKGYVGTGGGDAGIRIWKISDLINNEAKIVKHPFALMNRQDVGALKSVHLCGTDNVLGHTDSGILLHFSIPNESWTIVNEDTNFKSYATMSVLNSKNLVALGSTKGNLLLLHLDKTLSCVINNISISATTIEGKIHSISWYEMEKKMYLFISGPDGEFICSEVSIKNAFIIYDRKHVWVLPIAKHRWHMGVAMTNYSGKIFVVCGDRRGSLHLFKEDIREPVHTIHGIHDKNGVTSVQKFGNLFVSTGRDGIWRKTEINADFSKLHNVAQNRAAQGMDWLETVIPLANESSSTSFAVVGFHGRNFTVWSSKTGDTLVTIECGGGHRDWSFKVANDKSTLVFIKESSLHFARLSHNVTKETSVVSPYFHGGQITCIRYIDGFFNKSCNLNISYLVTGSEDTKIFVSVYTQSNTYRELAKLHHIFTIDDHISSVRTLTSVKIKSDDTNLSNTILFSGGGRATLNCYIIKINKAYSWTENRSVEHVCSHKLNINCRRASSTTNPETRYMDLAGWQKGRQAFVAAACSDALIRVFRIDLDQKKLFLINQSSQYSNCFLTIKYFTLKDHGYLISGATDGFIRIWKLCDTKLNHQVDGDTLELDQPCFEKRVHMSGINALDTWTKYSLKEEQESHDKVFIATGGDDNAVNLNMIMFRNESIMVCGNCHIENAHSTQITSVRFGFFSTCGELEVISTSIDQRLTKWRILLHEDSIKYEFGSSTYMNVADISSMEVWSLTAEKDHFHAAVCGQGIQILDKF
uniref:WD repeat-containing protein 6-like n=1 Tax=Styela clava TaxID=7725 RepID=UPI001939F8C2|nr:WD repeat-containing protein 6-like [Styela clava]